MNNESDTIEHYFRRDDVLWVGITPIVMVFSYLIWENRLLTISLTAIIIISVLKVRNSKVILNDDGILVIKKRFFRKDWVRTITHESIHEVMFITNITSVSQRFVDVKYKYEGKNKKFSFNYFLIHKPERLVKYFREHNIKYDYDNIETERDMEWRADQL